MKEKLFFRNSKGDKLRGVLSNPEDDSDIPIIVMAHGWTGSKESRTYTLLEELLNKEGTATFRFDFYGHGESGGKINDMTITEGIDDVLSAVKLAREKGFRNVGLFGSSFGGLCSILAAARIQLSALVLKYPVSRYLENMARNKGSHFVDDMKKYDAYKEAEKIRCPVLLMHGDADDVVPVEQSRKLSKVMKNCEYAEISGMTHYPDEGQLQEIAEKTTAFFAKIYK